MTSTMRSCVASPHHLASEAGAQVLRDGGTAVDAAVAANLVLGVVTPYYCGPGGDLFAIVWDGEPHALHSNGAAPAGATPAAIRDAIAAGHGSDASFPWTDGMPIFGALPVVVPGAVAGWFALLERFGSRTFGQVAEPALRLATEGIEISDMAAGFFGRAAQQFETDDVWKRVYGRRRAGERWTQTAHAALLTELAEHGPPAFYDGPVAAAIVATLQDRGSTMTADDLAGHRPAWVEPLRVRFRDLEVLELPPPTQGATACQVLATADRLDATGEAGLRTHRHVEVVRAAMADRDRYLAAPAAMAVAPTAIYADDRVAQIAASIDDGAAAEWPVATPVPGGTAYLCAADDNGQMVSLIQSNYVGFGSGVVVEEYGFGLHNRGAHFSLDPDSPNVIAPGKQPVHTLIPGLALRGGAPRYVFGTMGGDGQPQIHLQVLTALVDDGMSPQQAVAAARWIVEVADGSVRVEARMPTSVIDALRARGHSVTVQGDYEHGMGHAHLIEVLADGYRAGSDPRAEGSVAAG